MGAKIPKGAILYGPPGTGKTLLAKAVAGEANVPFFFASGSEFIEMLVGMGAKRIRELFNNAKKNSPCIIFIDEIDAIGQTRNRMRNSSENDQTLNQLLCELDGFHTDTNVILLCGTNQIEVLDPALIRSGRLDRKIQLAPPDLKGRTELFDYYLTKIKIDQNLRNFYSKRMAGLTPGTTGADTCSICNEAAIIATKSGGEYVDIIHLENAIDRMILGNRLSQKLSDKEKKIVSIHESGHAIVSWFLVHTFPILKISIVPRGQALGVNQFLPSEDKLYSKFQLVDYMTSILAGRAAEELIIGSISTGASDDLQKVTQLAYKQVGVFGMDDDIGLMAFPSLQRRFSDHNNPYQSNNSEYGPMDLIWLISWTDVLKKLSKYHMNLSEALYDKEILSNQEIEQIVGPRPEGATTINFIHQNIDYID
ncbi:hypothetical protein MXB_5176 [Myxobolus squamalis]|nr:hypothetical protein MXB_5176 [Myxobolus squamalis]